jgi:hypothetical protein
VELCTNSLSLSFQSLTPHPSRSFSSDGSSLFTVQCPGIGSSHLIRLSLFPRSSSSSPYLLLSDGPWKNKKQRKILSPSPHQRQPLPPGPTLVSLTLGRVIKVSNVPSCRLIGTSSHRSDCEDPTAEPILAYGDCEGVVSVFSMKDLKLVSSHPSPLH